MAKKKKRAPTRTRPAFEVRFVGSGIRPEKVPLHHVAEALSAMQDIAAARNSLEEPPVPKERAINLVDVKRGSAVYSCFSRMPAEALRNIKAVGRLVCEQDSAKIDHKALYPSITPIERLCSIARSVGCVIKVTADRSTEPILVLTEGDYQRIAERIFTTGTATVVGNVIRAGGATETKCLLRVEGRRKLLYWDVEDRDLLRRLGHNLYERVAVKGDATWIQSTWYIHKFKITSFTKPRIGNALDAIRKLREAGLSAWDDVDDPQSFLGELR